MAFNINEVLSNLTQGGARPSLFSVALTNPANAAAAFQVPFFCQAAQLPASTLGTIEIPYFGRKVKVAGDRTFAEWTITIIQDEDFRIRNGMEEWSNKINSHIPNRRTFSTPRAYKSDATITHFGKTGAPLRYYNFQGIFPSEISPVDLDWNTTDTLEMFTVTFQYDVWTVSGSTGTAGTTATAAS